MTANINDQAEENRTEFNCTLPRTGKSEAEVTNNKGLRSSYCTVEANYKHEVSHGLSATAELLDLSFVRGFQSANWTSVQRGSGMTCH